MIGKITGMASRRRLDDRDARWIRPSNPSCTITRLMARRCFPGVMGIEAFAEAAQCLLPGWHVEAVEEVNFLAPFKFYRNQPRTVTVQAVFHPRARMWWRIAD